MYKEWLHVAIRACFIAGEEILSVYNQPFSVNYKEDNSPVTAADERASKVIEDILKITEIPVLTEEGKHEVYDKRKSESKIWIVDPLDGTKEFIKRNGEFTVNIALAENQQAVIGVIYSPVFKDLYFAAKEIGSYKLNRHDVIEIQQSAEKMTLEYMLSRAQKLPINTPKNAYVLVASRSHFSSEIHQYVEELKKRHSNIEFLNIGSSIKMCMVAEGLANEYPRFGKTMEWDTCAGQCIIEQAGGSVVDYDTKKTMLYNKQDLKNNWFIARAKN